LCGKTRCDRIRNDNIRERKLVENRLTLFGHVEGRPGDFLRWRIVKSLEGEEGLKNYKRHY